MDFVLFIVNKVGGTTSYKLEVAVKKQKTRSLMECKEKINEKPFINLKFIKNPDVKT